MTDEQLALILDPERKRAGWWEILCDRGHETTRTNREYPNYCYPCAMNYKDEECIKGDFCGPPLATDRVAAFTHVVPVLRRLGWTITMTTKYWRCAAPVSAHQLVERRGNPGMFKDASLAPACAAAIAWLQENEPERLRKAVEEVGNG